MSDRQYLSGHQKRKLKEKRDQESNKYPKLTEFFTINQVGDKKLEIESHKNIVLACSSSSFEVAETHPDMVTINVEAGDCKLKEREPNPSETNNPFEDREPHRDEDTADMFFVFL
ncbi:unnamed protein product [Callosobruchus maculatus]|uniref:Uncharacterized protein n=1 Tax=Callosobruchus maculatus TaxID=64391 RepID=A0A653CPX6_CALMS|nr:unnamed protein product [Callosobruchus maculatus]